MAVIFQDNFTDTSTTDLSSHTPDTGTSWTLLWQNGTNNFDIKTNNIGGEANAASDGFIYTADATYPSANYEVEYTQVGLSTTGESPVYIFVRIQDVENMYAVKIREATTLCQLYKKVAGTWSTLGSAFDEPADGSVCKLQIIGSALKFFDDGVEVASATDSDITAAGKAGIGAGGGAELVTSTDDVRTDAVIDTLSVNDLGVVGGLAQPIFSKEIQSVLFGGRVVH